MARNIVLLLDGTSNEISSRRTSILRLYGTLAKSPGQVVWYDPGVGTFGADNAWSRWYRRFLEVVGMATGYGLDYNVKEAYRFLVETCRTGPVDIDRIHIFGFSRGAYSARVLAGFLHAFGLMEPRNLNLLDYAYRAYKRMRDNGDPKSLAEMALYVRMLRPFQPKVSFLGLFDTVASVIESGRFLPRLRNHAFTRDNPSVVVVRHAAAIDEKRTMFRPLLWKPSANGQDAREVWFTGVHGDVGGGVPEEESGLAKLPLRWLIDEAREAGLAFDETVVRALVLGDPPGKYVAPDPMARMHRSMNFWWAILEFLPRRKPEGSRRPSILGWQIPFFERRYIPDGARIHSSVLERAAAKGLQPNVPPDHVVEP